jgi:hypothetical protein
MCSWGFAGVIRAARWRLGSGIAVVKRNEINFPHERTGGVPLFVEEVTRLLLERGEQGGIYAIPPTLQQSLTARHHKI